MMANTIVGIIGGHAHNTSKEGLKLAERFGEEVGRRGLAMVCGGYDGVMEAASRECKRSGGTTLGILKGNDPAAANQYIDYPILTSMDVACNNIIVWTASVIIAFDGRYGTLNEMALALDFGKPMALVGNNDFLNVENIRSELFIHVNAADAMSRVSEILDKLLLMGKTK